MLHKKRMRVCTTILPLFQENYPNCVPQVPHAPQEKHPHQAGCKSTRLGIIRLCTVNRRGSSCCSTTPHTQQTCARQTVPVL